MPIDHHHLATAKIQTKKYIPKINHRQIAMLEDIYNITTPIETNINQFLAQNNLFDNNIKFPLKVYKFY